MLIILLIVSYIIIAGAAFDKVKFTGSRKVVFALTIFPVFFAAMFLNLWIMDHLFPHLMDTFSAEQARADALIKQGVGRRAARSTETPLAFLMSVPIALLLGAVWYWLIRKWDKAATTINPEKQKATAARNLAKFKRKYANQQK